MGCCFRVDWVKRKPIFPGRCKTLQVEPAIRKVRHYGIALQNPEMGFNLYLLLKSAGQTNTVEIREMPSAFVGFSCIAFAKE